jgi:hypothetical protein
MQSASKGIGPASRCKPALKCNACGDSRATDLTYMHGKQSTLYPSSTICWLVITTHSLSATRVQALVFYFSTIAKASAHGVFGHIQSVKILVILNPTSCMLHVEITFD